jgi:hypothetical protein
MRAGVAVKALSARTRWKRLALAGLPGSWPNPMRTRLPSCVAVLSSNLSTSPGFARPRTISRRQKLIAAELDADRPIGVVELGLFGRGEIPIAGDVEIGRDLVDDGTPLFFEIEPGALDQRSFRPGGFGGWKRPLKRTPQNPVIKRGRCCRPLCSVSHSRHDDKASGGSPNSPALRPMLGRARGATPPCALGSSQSRQRHGVGRARSTAPPCGRGSSENRQRRGVGSRFFRFLVILM